MKYLTCIELEGSFAMALFVAVIYWYSIARADDRGELSYKSLVGEALVELEAGRFEEARALFERAHDLNPNARTLRGMGIASYEARHYVDAIEAFEAALEEKRKPLTNRQRRQIERLLDNAYGFVARYDIEIQPEGASVTLDGNQTELRQGGRILLDAGSHELVVNLDGYTTEKRQVSAAPGKAETLHIVLTPLTEGSLQGGEPKDETEDPIDVSNRSADLKPGEDKGPGIAGRLWTWVALGGSVALGTAAIVFWLDADSRFEDAKKKCAPDCSNKVTDAIDRSAALGNIFIGLSAASAVGAAVLYFVEGNADEKAPDISALVGSDGFWVTGRF